MHIYVYDIVYDYIHNIQSYTCYIHIIYIHMYVFVCISIYLHVHIPIYIYYRYIYIIYIHLYNNLYSMTAFLLVIVII